MRVHRASDADSAIRDTNDERVEALRDPLDRTREGERIKEASARAGIGVQADAEAAIRLTKEGVEPHPAKAPKEKPAP